MKRRIVVTGAAALAVAGGGAAVAATSFGTPQKESEAVVQDAAQQLGVQPKALSNALKNAMENRVDAAVAAGRMTKAHGEALKKRLRSQDYPPLGGPGFGPPGGPGGPGFGHFGAAAAYLGLSEAELGKRLAGGKTLADVATAQGKSVDGLVSALVADEKKELDAAVSSGRLTQAQADELLSNAEQRFKDMANGAMPGPPPGAFDGGPPSSWPDASDA